MIKSDVNPHQVEKIQSIMKTEMTASPEQKLVISNSFTRDNARGNATPLDVSAMKFVRN